MARRIVPAFLLSAAVIGEFMRALFQTGFDMAAKGYPWERAPPGY